MKQYHAKILLDGKVVETSVFAKSPEQAIEHLRRGHPEYRACPISIENADAV